MDFRYKNRLILVLAIVAFFSLGIYFGYNQRPAIERIIGLSSKESPVEIQTDFAPFWEVWKMIDEKYPDASKVEAQARVYGAISGLVSSLDDPYSTFFNPEETKLFEEDIAGNFSGVGMEVGIKDKVLTVIAPLKGTPAERAGLKPGDKILKIDSTVTSDLSIEKAIKMIRGEAGTTVALTVFRDGDKEPREIKVVRENIQAPTLDTELREDGIFVISLYSFSANSPQLFQHAMKEFAESKSDKMLLDLRGNPGGYLDASIDMASWYLPSGKTVVIEDYGGEQAQKIYRSHGYDIFNDNLKFVILIDEGSASASEILAGAMQDYGKAKLVGTKSYGKGSVQEVIDVTTDTVFKITVANWLTPKGNTISKTGLTPDVLVEYTKKDIDAKRDPQMDKAVELLKNWTPVDKSTAL